LEQKTKMKLKHIAPALLALSLLAGCASNQTQLMGSIDPNEKTVSVPAGSMGILGPVKRKLTVNGWTTDEYDQIDTRYKVTVSTVRTQLVCLVEWSEVAYEVMFLDKKARREVFRLTGESCDDYLDVAEAFEKALKAAESAPRK
jgi:hypothetical protein